jgi:hypothetical protein
MMKIAIFILTLGSAAAVELGASELAELSNMKVTDAMREQARKEGFQKSNQTYTISASALKAKVQAEAEKVENYRIQSSQANSMASIMSQANSMTQSARLQEMAGLIEGKEKGTEMIKSLSAEAKEALAGLQKMWLDVTANTMEKVATAEAALPKGVEAMDPEKENANKGAFMPVEEIVTPFMNHLKALQTSFPELNPWTEKVEGFSSFLQKDSLESMFGSNLPGFRKYKQEFQGYKKEHQEQILDFMEMFQMDDILTVLQSPEF